MSLSPNLISVGDRVKHLETRDKGVVTQVHPWLVARLVSRGTGGKIHYDTWPERHELVKLDG